LRPIDVGFRQIRRAQAAPSIQIVLDLFFVELLWLHRRANIEGELMFVLHLDILAVHFNIGFALVDAKDIVARVKVVEAGLGKANLRAVLRDDNVVFRVQLGYLDGRFAFVQPQFRVGQARRNHRYRAGVAESEKDARRQEKLRLTCLRF
jgi:hypothetical protein